MDFPDSSVGKESGCNAGDPSSIPGLGRSTWRSDRLRTPVFLGFPGGSTGKESILKAGALGWENLLERERLPTPVFWPGESHRVFSPWGHKELDTTE